ncbi:MAG: hypothetical protein K0S32_2556 [Bacteroidetes bacterium]|jgi:hypothetical protein|nr:hypothetical protein [Bacteroidota bacterium]
MKHLLIILISTLFLSLGACKAKKKTESSGDNNAAKTEITCAAKVSFGSMGSGIDAKKYDEIKKIIEDKKVKYTEKTMGREGEREICLPLTELKGSDKTAFIDQLKKSASAGQLVSVSSN